ncbi:hypothetical protein [Streptomyces hirsutus]|uniref:hypothetical protein n=1 Tax=Streptomyces hirsutus TaxID=35620 RepID=UPI003673D5BD
MNSSYQHLLTAPGAAKSPQEVLGEPVTVLLGVSAQAAQALALIHIETVFDLAASATFHAAVLAAGATTSGNGVATQNGSAVRHLDARPGRLPLDLVDKPLAGTALTDLAAQQIAVLRGIDDAAAAQLAGALSVSTVRDLGLWPPYHAARTILSAAYGAEPDPGPHPEPVATDLLPSTGQYPTERVQYQVLLLEELLDPGGQMAKPPDYRKPLEQAGPIDLLQEDVQGFTKPAVGAVLTYSQSWYTQGLTLGHLLHSLALAPGETTRIAMVDWSRRTSARISEGVSEQESLEARLTHGRSLKEVVDAVAKESQSGFSMGGGAGVSSQTGSGAGGAVDLGKTTGFPLNIAAGVTGSFGLGASGAMGYSTSKGRRDIHAEMSQKIEDTTHQAASSARSRWATVVREVSQQESERLSTRAVANFNHMHALTVQYYEVVQLYRTVVELARVERCLFLPMRTIRFRGTDAALRHRALIAANGLVPAVRALAYADTDSVLLSAPDRVGDWQASHELREHLAKSSVSGDLTAAALVLPDGMDLAGLVIEALPGDMPKISDVFAGCTQHLPSGVEWPAALLEQDANGNYPLEIPLAVSLSNLVGLTLRKKPGQEGWHGQLKLRARIMHRRNPEQKVFDSVDYSGGGPLHFAVDVPAGADQPLLRIQRTYGKEQFVRHLEDNALYYSQLIWRNLDATHLAHILDGYTLSEGDGATRRSLAELVDQVPLAVSGNYLVLRMPADAAAAPGWEKFLADKRLRVGEQRMNLVPLPSGGVFAEAVLGRSNSAEKIDLTRFWNWQDSPIPFTATNIADLQAASRAQPEPDGAKPLGTSVVNIQNSPALPEPQGMTAILQALANGAMFRDMSGLAGTQGLVRAFLEQTMAGATEAGRQAGQNMKTAADYVSKMAEIKAQQEAAQRQGSATDPRWGGPTTPNSLTAEGGRLNYGRQLDERLDQGGQPAQKGTEGGPEVRQNEVRQYQAGFLPVHTEPGPDGLETAGYLPDRGHVYMQGEPAGPVRIGPGIVGAVAARASAPNCGCYDASITYFADAAKLAGAELTYLSRFSIWVPRMLNSDFQEVTPMEFYALWGSLLTWSRWTTLPVNLRGLGAPGALIHAGLADENDLVESDSGWPSGLVPGALLQLWADRDSYIGVRDHRRTPPVGHSCVFLGYGDGNNQIRIADQSDTHRTVTYPLYSCEFVIGVNPGRAVVFHSGTGYQI